MANKILYFCMMTTVCTLAMIAVIDAQGKRLSDICLGCICHSISGCDQTAYCTEDTCGLFRITWRYWADGGKLTLNGESPVSETAYPNCVNDPYCAANTIQNYMSKYARDCNNDNKVDCLDYAAIHKLGPYGCKGELTEKYKTKLQSCLNTFNVNLI